jgi:hypothetical protein
MTEDWHAGLYRSITAIIIVIKFVVSPATTIVATTIGRTNQISMWTIFHL